MDNRFTELVANVKKYNPSVDVSLLQKAFDYAKKAHEGQLRESGEPYITHPVEVAHILADMELDTTTIIAGLLHDTVEDTNSTLDEIKEKFGESVASLVDGVTKLERLPYSTKEEQQAENLRKMFIAMAKDIRVILIKLADRLHNMNTLNYLPKDRQEEKARETLEIYAPLAHRLGIFRIKWELEDVCFRNLHPKEYYDLGEKIAQRRKERVAYINRITDEIMAKTAELGIKAQIEGRPKHFYSIYKKMQKQNKTLDQIYDLFAVRVIVDSVKDCYAVLGLVHELYKPLPGRFKDYIAMPKPNMYQSLHTTLIGHEGHPFEVQIRTWDMHKVAEYGIAAHWKYKEGITVKSELDKKLAWLRQMMEWQKEAGDANEFIENVKIDLFADEVFVFTPKGDVVNLPAGSIPVDFAYAIHSAIGNKMVGAKVNGEIVKLNYTLKNGDIVEIITSANAQGPSRDWLKMVKSSQARNKIRQWFKKENREENVQRGKEYIDRELKKQGFAYNQLFRSEWVDLALKKYNFNTLDDMFSAVGYGGISASKIVTRLREEYRKTLKPDELAKLEDELHAKQEKEREKRKKTPPENGVIVKGIHNCLVRLSRCCNPVPGDDIIGYITRGRGVSVHRKDCPNISKNHAEDERLIEVQWYTAVNLAYMASITVLANDRVALLMDVTNAIGESKIPLKAMNARTTRDQIAIINLTLEIIDTEQLDKIIRKLKKLDSVFEVTRNKQ
ncbi:MAG: RelA/SpoT family protein [Acetivibrionales bacterium]|jgi:guanosine-3',5'-bis(diphosphate) 3'-pyrophosphohydrolase